VSDLRARGAGADRTGTVQTLRDLHGVAGVYTDGAIVRRRYVVRGVVQGVGFRPFVHATATRLALTGSVRNDSGGVVVEVEGRDGDVAEFARVLRAEPPPLALVQEVRVDELDPLGGTGFTIDASRAAAGDRTPAPPDVATCTDCLRELADPADRRYRHPFISCTNCGPRFTVITDLPYDRPATTMAGFPMCADCAREYADPADRRFHAQPIACPACGPRLEFLGADGTAATGESALAATTALLAAGGVVAVKGLGGYHLACTATDERAVATLRRRKQRGDKPFAVMVRDLVAARALVDVDPVSEALLTGPARPIVLLPRLGDALAPSVAPGNPDLGLLLPYTPIHHLLLSDPLVMTSGNLGGEPIAHDDADARVRLAPLVDGWLGHDRPIAVPCDDSVVRVVDGEELPIRRSRGYAPLPVPLPFPVPPSLAVGGDLKNTCALGSGRSAWLSGHVGDMDDLATLTAFDAAERHLEHLTAVVPERLAADAHPRYRSHQWAIRHAAGRPLRTVQHHHAHVAAVLAEHGHAGSPVIGVAFDGTGYGTDGAVWGGEVLVADYRGFRRAAHLAYVPLAGGDAAVHRPYRMALAHLRAAGAGWDTDLPPVAACPPVERAALAHQLATGLGCVPTSSMGRLFDAVSSLLGIRHVVDFEAQAAIELESRARGVDPNGAYAFALAPNRELSGQFLPTRGELDGDPLIADPGPVLRALVADLRAGVAVGVAAARFHAAVVALIVKLARRIRDEQDLDTVALSGGVFGNALLLGGAARALRADGFTVLRHRRVPPNDGGLALGQLVVSAAVIAVSTGEG
jgi:hydrogenase maturation protein HypF